MRHINGGQPKTGHLDAGNSTATPLGIAGVFTGAWVDAGGYSNIVVAVSTDKDGQYAVQFSPDGVNVDSSLTRYYRINRINAPHNFTMTRRYARIVYTNGAAAQTYLRLRVHIGEYPQLNAPTDGVLPQDYDAIVVRPTDPRDEIAMGRRQGKTLWHKWGYNGDIDTGASEMVWCVGGNMTFLTTASTLSVASTSALDTSAGTGARGVVIYGLDANRLEQIEVVMLTGTTPVVTTSTWLGINRMALFSAGSTQVNQGNIDATAVTGGSIQARIPVGEGSTQQAAFFTQANETGLAEFLLINANKVAGGSAPKVDIRGWVLSFVSNAKYEIFRYVIDTSVENHIDINMRTSFPVGERSVLYFTAQTDTNNTVVSMRYTLTGNRSANG